MPIVFRQLYAYRDFIRRAIVNDFRLRFVRSRFAVFWVIAQPLIQVSIFALILSNVLDARLLGVSSKFGYAIHVLAGLVVWGLFAECVTRLSTCFVDHANSIKKISYPKVCAPAISVGIALCNFAILAILTIVFVLLAADLDLMAMFSLLPVVVITVALGSGLGLIVGTFNVFIRDAWQVANAVLQFWFWFTPIVYPMSSLGTETASLLRWNPVFPLVDATQNALLRGQTASLDPLLYPAAIASVLCACGFFLFRRAADEMADVL